MLVWYEIRAPSSAASANVLKSLRKQKLMARLRDGALFACISTTHTKWLEDVCRDFNASLQVLKVAPEGVRGPLREVYTAPCGEQFYDPVMYSHHFRSCPKCKAKSDSVVAKLEPGQDLTLNGVIASIEIVRDQMWEKLEGIDKLLTDLKGYRDAKEQLVELSAEASKRINSIRLLMNDGKL